MSAADDIRAAREELEQAIWVAASQAVAKFSAITGTTPAAIDIHMTGCSHLGEPIEYIVAGATARIEL